MKAKIMVVDDDSQVRSLIATILESNGYEPILKATAAELRASFAEPQPDVILLDLVLPDGDGLGTAAANQKTMARHRSHHADRPRHVRRGGGSDQTRGLPFSKQTL